jgi:hypothetical protein
VDEVASGEAVRGRFGSREKAHDRSPFGWLL